jgi:hypothetical protein
MAEITSLRTENSKDYSLGGGKFQRVITGQPQHYKDDYKDTKEAWKNIDLTIVNGRVDKAPYIMVIDGNKVSVTDKKTGQQSVVELLKIGDTTVSKTDLSTDSKSSEIIKDVDYDLVFNETKIKFQRTIKTAEALKEATFKITGDIPVVYSAVDADGDAVQVDITQDKGGNVVESFIAEKTLISEKDGTITESKVAPTYPIKIDPTLTIQGSGSDAMIYEFAKTTNYGSSAELLLQGVNTVVSRCLVNMSLSGLPSGATVNTATFSGYYYDYGSFDPNGRAITLYKVRRADWVEAEVTWNIYKTSNNWGTAGCANTSSDIDTSKTAATNAPASYGWIDWNVKDIVEDAVANSVNFNIRMSMATGNYVAKLYSKEYATDTSKRPKLVIEYTSGGLPKHYHYYQKMMG